MRTMSARKRQRGSALLEYAVIVTVFLMLIFGIIDFGRALYTYHYLSNAARDATRWSAVNGTTCNSDGSCNGTGGMNNGTASTTDIKNYVKNNVPSAIDPAKLTTNVNFLNSNGPTACGSGGLAAPGCTVQVQISYAFNFVTPLVFNKTMTLSSTSEMVIAH